MRFLSSRRTFLKGLAGTLCVPDFVTSPCSGDYSKLEEMSAEHSEGLKKGPYRGPRVIIFRFGGGVRRAETIESATTYAPFFCKHLIPRGTLYSNMELSNIDGVETSHSQGTLHILTGGYKTYRKLDKPGPGDRFEATVPTLFEYLRKSFSLPSHETLLVNNENRAQEEFLSFSAHNSYGIRYQSDVLSWFRFKYFYLSEQLEQQGISKEERRFLEKELGRLEKIEQQVESHTFNSSDALRQFWKRWGKFYGNDGMVQPRGDRLLTELTVWGLRYLRPKLVMVNYNDPDYVHWGYPSHYTRGISVIDQGIQRIYEWVQQDSEYRDSTIFVVVPDCGRDSNRCITVPFQHHFHAHRIFALFWGKGVSSGVRIDKLTDQTQVAPTIAALMGFKADYAEADALAEVFST